MKKRLGAVIVFRPEVTREQAERILDSMKWVLDGSGWAGGRTPVHDYIEEHGGPVWYIP